MDNNSYKGNQERIFCEVNSSILINFLKLQRVGLEDGGGLKKKVLFNSQSALRIQNFKFGVKEDFEKEHFFSLPDH